LTEKVKKMQDNLLYSRQIYAPFGKFRLILYFFLTCSLISCGGNSSANNSNSNEGCPIDIRLIGAGLCPALETSVAKVILSGTELVNSEQSICSGVAIANNTILSAAHCFMFTGATSANVSISGKTSMSRKVLLHPRVRVELESSAIFNDVALITLQEPIATKPVKLGIGKELQLNETLFVYGYGKDQFGEFGSLKAGSMLVSGISSAHLFSLYSGSGTNTCGGDSGGPAFRAKEDGSIGGLIGILSTGRLSNCGKGDISLFTRIDQESILSFISSNVEGILVE